MYPALLFNAKGSSALDTSSGARYGAGMKTLLMLMLSTAVVALLGGALYAFFVRLKEIEAEFWGHERHDVKSAQAPHEASDAPGEAGNA